MTPVRQTVLSICGIVLIGFILIGTGIKQNDFSWNYEKAGKKSPRIISGHEKKLIQTADSSLEEVQPLRKWTQRSGYKFVRGAVFLAVYFLTVVLLWRMPEDRVRIYLDFYMMKAFYMIRFRYEMMIQKEKDGKKKYGCPGRLKFKTV